MNLNEAKDYAVFSGLLDLLGSYSDKFPATGVDKMFNKLIDNGIKVVPKDKGAIAILSYVLANQKTVPARVQELLNLRFSDLPVCVRPLLKAGRSKECAFWSKGSKVNDKVLSLLDFELEKEMFWCNARGEEVELIEVQDEV